MKILALDTSAKAASVAVADEEKIIGEFFVNTAFTHSRTLIPMTEQLLINTGLSLDDIDAMAVNAGPGSFTGVRIGVAAVKGMAFKNNIKCICVSTLESMAYNMLSSDCTVCAVMDARCSQVYNALFRVCDGRVERITPDRAISINELKTDLRNCSDKVVLVGDGAELVYESLKDKFKNICIAPKNYVMQRASSTAMAAFELYKQGKTMTCGELMPVYLRLPQAQRELKKRMEDKN